LNRIAAAFTYPFRAGAGRWLAGSLLVFLWPLAVVPLLGYATAAVRSSAADPAAAPPAWRVDGRLLRDGAWTALAVALFSAPFVVAWWPLSGAFSGRIAHTGEPLLDRIYGVVAAGLALALPWGAVLLVQMPPASARFATAGRARDLFDVAASFRAVRENYAAWNLAVAAIVTGWVGGLLVGSLCCVGVLPGAFYAILVSAHASAALAPTDQPAG
jgi:Protein of unknown function (DUF4013)